MDPADKPIAWPAALSNHRPKRVVYGQPAWPAARQAGGPAVSLGPSLHHRHVVVVKTQLCCRPQSPRQPLDPACPPILSTHLPGPALSPCAPVLSSHPPHRASTVPWTPRRPTSSTCLSTAPASGWALGGAGTPTHIREGRQGGHRGCQAQAAARPRQAPPYEREQGFW